MTIVVIGAFVVGGFCIFYSHLFEGFLVCVSAIVIAGVLVLMRRLDTDVKELDLGPVESVFHGVVCYKDTKDVEHIGVLAIHEKGIRLNCGDLKDKVFHRSIPWDDVLLIGHDEELELSVGLLNDGVYFFVFPNIIKYKSARQYFLRHDVHEIIDMEV